MSEAKLLKRKKAADENWDKIYKQIMEGKLPERSIIVDAMDQCNKIDKELMKIREKQYFISRKNF